MTRKGVRSYALFLIFDNLCVDVSSNNVLIKQVYSVVELKLMDYTHIAYSTSTLTSYMRSVVMRLSDWKTDKKRTWSEFSELAFCTIGGVFVVLCIILLLIHYFTDSYFFGNPLR